MLFERLVRHHAKFDDHKIVRQLDQLRGAFDIRRPGAVPEASRDVGRWSGRSSRVAADPELGLPWMTRCSAGSTGGRRIPSIETLRLRWKCIVGTRLGFDSLEEMRIQWAKESMGSKRCYLLSIYIAHFFFSDLQCCNAYLTSPSFFTEKCVLLKVLLFRAFFFLRTDRLKVWYPDS